MAKKLRILISETHNPWFNLATEEWIFKELDPSTQTLFLWQNQNTVVIGRNQNPWSECNLTRMEEDGVTLARRTSGGGAVFQDLGNSCFTFLSPRDGYSRNDNNTILLNALRKAGITAEASGRNDLVVAAEDGPRKISGSAFRETRDRAFHHGTFLLDVDLSRLANYLTPHPKKLESKGRQSVRSRVMNLSEVVPGIDHKKICAHLIDAFFDFHGVPASERFEPEILNPNDLSAVPELKATFEQFGSWEWRFGHAPKFHQQMAKYFSWGFVELYVDSEHGKFEKARLFSDALNTELVMSLEKALIGKAFTRVGVEAASVEAISEHPDQHLEIGEFREWLIRQVEI